MHSQMDTLEMNAPLESVPMSASMSALMCVGFLPFAFQLLKVFLDVQSLMGSRHGTQCSVLTMISFIQHRIRAILSCSRAAALHLAQLN